MKKLIGISLVIFSICTSLTTAYAQAPAYVWAKTILGNVEAIQRGVVVDGLGNVYITGVFFGTVDFDPGAGLANVTPVPYGSNAYIAKYDANGNFLWIRNVYITASYGNNSIAVDGSNNVYITGFFTGTATDFKPGAGVVSLTSAGGNDIYIAKYDCNGNYLWAKSIGSTGDDRGNEVITDAFGNVFLTGDFSATVDFDPGAAVANLTSAGGTDVFIAKYNSAGVYQWAKQIGGASADDIRDIAIDISGNILLTGNFAGIADFDPGNGVINLTSAGGNDIFLVKYDAAGNYTWANRYGGSGTDGGSALKTDATGNVFVTGIFASTVDFNPGAAVANLTTASSALFYGKYDVNGNLFWIKQLPINFYSMDLTLDVFGNIFISGYYGNGYASPIDMDPGAGVANLLVPSNLPPPTYNILGKYDANGNYLWAGVFGHQCYCSVMAYKSSLFIDAAGYLYYSGIFNGNAFSAATVDFDPGAGVANLTAPSSVDNTFFAKYLTTLSPLPVQLISFNGENKNGVNHLLWATASEINNDYFEVERSKDGIEFEKIGKVDGHGNSTQILSYSLDDKNPFNNLNYYCLKQVDYNGNYTYSNVIAVKAKASKNNSITYSIENGILTLHNYNSQIETIELISIEGRILKIIKSTESDNRSIDLNSFPNGLYVLRIYDGENVQSIKLVKN
ncbi:MAG: SBBP repeat-containing protein [Bacteroidia bacterium]